VENYDDPALSAFVNVTAESMQGMSADGVLIVSLSNTSVDSQDVPASSISSSSPDNLIYSRHDGSSKTHMRQSLVHVTWGIRSSGRRRLGVDFTVAVEVYFTVTAVMEQFGFSDPYEFAHSLQDQINISYTGPNISTDFVSLAGIRGSQYINNSSEVVFTEPRFSDEILLSVVNTGAPTSVPANDVQRNSNDSTAFADNEMYLYIGAAVIIIVIAVCCLRCLCKTKTSGSNQEQPVQETVDVDFDDIEYYNQGQSTTVATPKWLASPTGSQSTGSIEGKGSSPVDTPSPYIRTGSGASTRKTSWFGMGNVSRGGSEAKMSSGIKHAAIGKKLFGDGSGTNLQRDNTARPENVNIEMTDSPIPSSNASTHEPEIKKSLSLSSAGVLVPPKQSSKKKKGLEHSVTMPDLGSRRYEGLETPRGQEQKRVDFRQRATIQTSDSPRSLLSTTSQDSGNDQL